MGFCPIGFICDVACVGGEAFVLWGCGGYSVGPRSLFRISGWVWSIGVRAGR